MVLKNIPHPDSLITNPKQGTAELAFALMSQSKLFDTLFSDNRASILSTRIEHGLKNKIYTLYPEYKNILEKFSYGSKMNCCNMFIMKKEYLEKSVSTELEKLMQDKVIWTSKEKKEKKLPVLITDTEFEEKYASQVIYPIISEGDTIGTVMLLSKEPSIKMNDVEMKVVQSAAGFLGKQMEE